MDEAYQFLLEELKKNGETIVAGISGGPDSMALLHLLTRLRDEKNTRIICAHINHNVREESANEAEFLKKYCEQNKIIFEIKKIEKYSNDNFETEARMERYNFFEELIQKYNATYLMTAHHGDDLMETILMRLVRGSTFKGYAGFLKTVDRGFYKIIRPLIGVTKDEIIDYNKDNDLEFAVDMSNRTDIHTRNRYRKYVLPFLKKEDSNVHKKFLKFSQTILEYNEYMDIEMNKIIDKVYKKEVLYLDEFLKLNKVMQDRIINYIMETVYREDLMLITDVHTALVIKLINSNKPNSYVILPNNFRVIKSYDTLSFKKNQKKNTDYEIEFTSNLILPNGKSLEIVEDNDDKSNYICRLNSNELTMPLYVRNKRNGDRMEVKGMIGGKKIKDIFIDEKISMDERDIMPILVDKDGRILWLPGLKKSKYDKSKKESYDIIIRYY